MLVLSAIHGGRRWVVVNAGERDIREESMTPRCAIFIMAPLAQHKHRDVHAQSIHYQYRIWYFEKGFSHKAACNRKTAIISTSVTRKTTLYIRIRESHVPRGILKFINVKILIGTTTTTITIYYGGPW